MKKMLKRTIAALAVTALSLAGGLYLQVGNPEANPEAKKLGAVLTARVTACHEPAKSTVTANLLSLEDNRIRRTPLRVAPLSDAASFAVIGGTSGDTAAIELTVSNPQFGTYQRRVLVRAGREGVAWGTVKDLGDKAPTAADVRALQEPGARAAIRP